MTKREQIQLEAFTELTKHPRAGAAISMRVGKTYLGLQVLDYYQPSRILVVYPKLSIRKSWEDDIKKFGFEHLDITYTTYLSLDKQSLDYDVVVLDECHSLTIKSEPWLKEYRGIIVGLTGTPSKNTYSDKYRLVATYCPIVYTYIVNDAVEDKILSDYRVIVHKLRLSGKKDVLVQLKNRQFWTSEQESYNYWTEQVASADRPQTRQIKSIMRMRSMMDFKTKEDYAKKLTELLEYNKLLVFCNTTEQSDRLVTHTYHSKNKKSEENLQLFQDGSITRLGCVAQLSEGLSFNQLDSILLLHAFGNERKSMQRLARALLPEEGKTANIHVLCYKDTIDEKWVETALAELNQDKIRYVDGEFYLEQLKQEKLWLHD